MTNRRMTAAALVLMLMAMAGARAAEFHVGGMVGYKGGFGLRVTGTVSEFAQGFPLALEVGAGMSFFDPGKSDEVRRIFINDATNGTPEKSGSALDFRLDFLYRVKIFGMQQAYLYAGPRLSSYTGTFNYIGGNEKFDITTTQWGIGAGMKAVFPMGARVSFVLTVGAENYFNATLLGHDTSYGPDGETVNGTHEYTYKDADAAVNQPKIQGVGMIGISYRL